MSLVINITYDCPHSVGIGRVCLVNRIGQNDVHELVEAPESARNLPVLVQVERYGLVQIRPVKKRFKRL